MQAEVREHNGAPTIFVNGAPFSGVNFRNSYWDHPGDGATYPPGEKELRLSRDMAACGIRSHMWPTAAASRSWSKVGQSWNGPKEYDYSVVDESLRLIAETSPDGYLFPSVFLGSPVWWTEQNPDHLRLVKTQDGDVIPYVRPPLPPGDAEYPTAHEHRHQRYLGEFASAKWRDDTSDALRSYLRHVLKLPLAERIMGFHIMGQGNEWLQTVREVAPGFAPTCIAAYQEWLEKKYGKLAQLNQAWGSRHDDLSKIEPPDFAQRNATHWGAMLDPVQGRSVMDFNLFYAELLAETICHFARIVKEETEGTRLVMTFYGYVVNLGKVLGHDMAHSALRIIYSCPDIDLLTSPNSYSHRRPGVGFPMHMSLTESVHLHKKVWLAQNDYRTFTDPDTDANTFYGRTDTETESIEQLRYVFLNDVSKGVPTQYHDQLSCRYDSPGLHAAVRELVEIADRAVATDRQSVDEIALVVDETGAFRYGRTNPLLDRVVCSQIGNLGHVGAPFGLYALADLDMAPAHKLWIFANCVELNDEALARINNRMRQDGATALFIHACGLSDGQTLDPAHISRLTGFPVAVDLNAAPERVTFADGSCLEYAEEKTASPLFYLPQEEGLNVLGRYPDGRAALAIRTGDGHTSAYSAVPGLPAGILRHVARLAGVHLYTEGDEAVFANASFLGVMSPHPGKRQIHLPKDEPLYDLFSDTELAGEAEFVENQSKLFYRGTKAQWEAIGSP